MTDIYPDVYYRKQIRSEYVERFFTVIDEYMQDITSAKCGRVGVCVDVVGIESSDPMLLLEFRDNTIPYTKHLVWVNSSQCKQVRQR